MSKKFSQMLAELGFSLPSGRERFMNRPMPIRSSEVDINPDPNVPDTGISSGEDNEGMSDMDGAMPFDFGDDKIVILSTKMLKKLLGIGSMGDTSDMDDSDRMGADDLPDEDDLFGQPNGDVREPRNGGLGSLSSEEDGKLSSEEDFGRKTELGNAANFQDEDGLDGGVPGGSSEEDDDRQGSLRSVKGARLTFKRQMPDGTFQEMWIFNVGETLKDSLQVKRAILSGTDIPENQFESADGKQRYKIVTLGNAQIIKIEGLSS